MGQKLPLCAQLGATRSRQDESKEVCIGEVGSKRTSSGCNGVHHVCWGGQIFRLWRCFNKNSRSLETSHSRGQREVQDQPSWQFTGRLP
jgi:hypothetical protein